MSPKFTPPRWIWIVLAISTLASLYVGLQRFRLENSNKAVRFVADMPDIKQLAAVSGLPIRNVLLKLKQSGLTGVAVAEDTFDDLLVSGRLVAIGGGPRGQSIYVCPNPQLALRVQKVIESRFGPAPAFAPAIIESDKTTFSLPGRVSDLKGFGLGVDRESANLVRAAGLSVIARVGNPPVSTRASISN